VRIHLVLTPHVQENAQSWNVVAEKKGRETPNEIVLIGAHLDSWDLGTGAIDDGAGVAIVTTVGKLVAALPQRPRRTVRVVLFGAEEMDHSGPAYGAAHAAEAPHIAVAAEADFGARQVYAVQLPASLAHGDFAKTLGDVIAPLGAFIDPRPALFGGDDIRPLGKLGVPPVSLRQNGIDYFDIHHTADDTLDKIDPRDLAQATSVWAAFVYLAAESDADFRSK
jgi:Zn-dependent M28 family amino/carboxypeptidase